MEKKSYQREQLTTTIRSDLLKGLRHLMVDMGIKNLNEMLEQCISCLLERREQCIALKRLNKKVPERIHKNSRESENRET